MLSVIPNPPRIGLPIDGSEDLFPVRRVYCVGRNYAAHAREMGHDPDREPPFFFMKPADALQVVTGSEPVPHPYPPRTENYHFEVELVAAIGTGGRDIPVSEALDHVYGYAIGLDMTRRDLQEEAKKLSRPWDLGKAADASAPIGLLHPAARIGHPQRGAITLTVDRAERQRGDLSEMIWSVAEQIAFLSGYFELHPGDLVFTGTPSGVGPVRRGETMEAAIEGLGRIALAVA
ncbi:MULTISPECIES: fumarylacetoacetate hydrolase family protein [Methylobacterium]|uniref:Fumarylpyruvate hydrolase n=2 Tax=Pseudomonadota TaxID=1224 RepID=A0ABQ4SWZ9_9HYPH|nr:MULTISPECIES: fumarylacetoacetate hydrolase family protein [Methylobacterium]PIU07538.1 MAG: fumarylacetoacetate hydrolase [Methylobacterium sp. CG09_land_8_20_14_0_10_71_15]PIU13325.1 MAG: fumarylacetoacetate hydrolase [Methylobacterium sp. CG08_land_8_20_14_0_20_71_15]GBU17762.1 isomerase [Methylobacterium sp.]GJE06408.1 Fumarylpyruvate hydrolase [Methylobacterium jeotgali]